MKPQWQVQMTLSTKDEPYDQADVDAVIGHSVNLEMNISTGKTVDSKLPLVGTITDAQIQPDGSLALAMEVTAR